MKSESAAKESAVQNGTNAVDGQKVIDRPGLAQIGAQPRNNKEFEEYSSVELKALHERLEMLQAELEKTRREKENAENLIDDLIGSISWRITKPLRSVAAFCRVVFPLWRLRERQVGLGALRNAVVKEHSQAQNKSRSRNFGEQKVEITGPSPALLIDMPENECPSGWIKLAMRIGDDCPAISFLFYSGINRNFAEDKRVLFSCDSRHGGETFIYIPKGSNVLRLDPYVSQDNFTLKFFQITEVGTAQVVSAALKKQARRLGSDPRAWLRKISKAIAILREGGLIALFNKLHSSQHSNDYPDWIKRYDTLDAAKIEKVRAWVDRFDYRPLVSVVMPVYNAPPQFLRAAIESVKRQIYPHWELCIADDCSGNPDVRPILEEYARDPRIKVVFREVNGHISEASNSALELASGEYLAFLDHDDELREHALAQVVGELNAHRDAVLLYSDEDKITEGGQRFNPYFKSGWNPELLLSQNYVCHLLVIARSAVQQVGGFRKGLEGAQDWDLILRVSESLAQAKIRHIPHVLYHWRVNSSSTAQSTLNKPYVLEAQARAVREHLVRCRVQNAKVEILHSISQLRVRRPVPSPAPPVSIIIPTRDCAPLLKVCVESIFRKTKYENFEITVVDNGSEKKETFELFEDLKRSFKVNILRDVQPFNFSRLNNSAAQVAKGELLAFLNNDLEVISEDWLSEMVSQAVRPEVGAVGARLLFPNGLLQHGGIILGIGGVAGHNHKGRPRHDPGYFNRAVLPQNLSAVTAACLLTRREVFSEVQGFDETLAVAFNDVDLCLRIRSKGYLIVYDPYAELYHYESASRGYENTPRKFARFEGEVENMKQRWKSELADDPYYNPNLTLLTEDFRLAFPPRRSYAWAND